MEKYTRKFYNKIGAFYHQARVSGKAPNNEFLVNPAALKIIGNVNRKRVLDLGCGTGVFSRKLKERGAMVSGIDLSPAMIEIAKGYAPGIEFRVGTATKLPYSKGSFDCVVSLLVMNYVTDFDKALQEVWRVTKTGGYFIAVISNPVVAATRSVRNKKGKHIDNRMVRKFDRYFEERVVSGTWHFKEGRTGKTMRLMQRERHMTYQTIIRKFLNGRFEIVDYADPQPVKGFNGKGAKEWYRYSYSVPRFCIFKLKKVKRAVF